MAKSVFFVGYSLFDLDIARIVASTEQMLEKTFFIVGSNPTPRTESRAVRYGTLQRFDSAWLGKQLETKRSRYTPAEILTLLGSASNPTRPGWVTLL
jgi:hypothetical protein